MAKKANDDNRAIQGKLKNQIGQGKKGDEHTIIDTNLSFLEKINVCSVQKCEWGNFVIIFIKYYDMND